MNRKFRLLPNADSDLEELFAYLAENAELEIAIRFYDSAFSSFDRLTGNPLAGKSIQHIFPNLSDLRIWPVKDFKKYLIFYRLQHGVVEIIRVMHSSRDNMSIIVSEEVD